MYCIYVLYCRIRLINININIRSIRLNILSIDNIYPSKHEYIQYIHCRSYMLELNLL